MDNNISQSRRDLDAQMNVVDVALQRDPNNETLMRLKEVITKGDDLTQEMLNVTDSEFVPEGFHENCREDDGSIKIIEQNKHLYQDNDHLVKMFKDGLWACEEGVTYTTFDAQCPDGRSPTIDAIQSLSLIRDINFKGRIVCEGGKTFDADTQNFMMTYGSNPNHPRILKIQTTFQKAMEDFSYWNGDMGMDYEGTMDVSTKASEESGIPPGKYVLQEKSFKITEDGLSMFSVCDEPDCCLMNHVMLGTCASGLIHPQVKQVTMNYFKQRKMYKMEDHINGNFDICHRCLKECGGH